MLKVLNHPLITHKLAYMRDEKTGTKDFSQHLDEIASLMAISSRCLYQNANGFM